VAPDHLRFDFNHPEPMTRQELLAVEAKVNQAILSNYQLNIAQKPLDEAIKEGAMALFGEKYEGIVRTITIGEEDILSYELCGGTHVDETGDIGLFLITYEGSIAAGIRRIEAVTGWKAYQVARDQMNHFDQINAFLGVSSSESLVKVKNLSQSLTSAQKEIENLRKKLVADEFDQTLQKVEEVEGIKVLRAVLPNASIDALREMSDKFRNQHPSGVILLASEQNGKPIMIAAVTDDLVQRGLNAVQLVQKVARVVGGGGGGKPTLAQAGGKDASKLSEALDQVTVYIRESLNQ